MVMIVVVVVVVVMLFQSAFVEMFIFIFNIDGKCENIFVETQIFSGYFTHTVGMHVVYVDIKWIFFSNQTMHDHLTF